MKQPRTMTEPFILQYAENIDFSSISHWWAPWLGYFIRYSFGVSRNKASTVFYGTAFMLWSCRSVLVSSPQYGENTAFFPVFPVARHSPFWWFSKGCVIEKGWCLFLWRSKGITNKTPQPWSPPKGKLEKRLYFHRTVEMKQPRTMTEPKEKAVSRETADTFSLKLQRNNHPNALTINHRFR